MTRNLSAAALSALHSQTTDKAFFTLLTLTHPDFASPGSYYFVDNVEAITSNSIQYDPLPFEVTLPDDNEERGPRGRLVVANTDQVIIQYVRSVSGSTRITCDLAVVMTTELDTELVSFSGFEFTNIRYNVDVIEGDLNLADFLTEPFPRDQFTPNLFPGIF